MEVKKTVDLKEDRINIEAMYEKELLWNCTRTSTKYNNNIKSFNKMLQKIADDSFKLGQRNP